jgi:anti-anti-sigma factor
MTQTPQSLSSRALEVSGEFTLPTIDQWRTRLIEHLMQNPELALDLHAVNSCDTASLQLLCSVRKSALRLNKSFLITALSDELSQTITALGLSLKEGSPLAEPPEPLSDASFQPNGGTDSAK